MVHEVESGITITRLNKWKHTALASVVCLVVYACGEGKEHTAPAIHDRDSVSMMTSYGVNTLISDSGVMKYKIVAERWDVNTVKNPTRWTFEKGVFFEQFDEKFHVEAYIQADTAWYYDQLKLWELRGRVRLRNVSGLVFTSEELFWDGMKHLYYSNKFSRIVTPERTLQGTHFESDERMTRYSVNNSKGSFIRSDMDGSQDAAPAPPSNAVASTGANATTDTTATQPTVRQKNSPHAATPKPQQP